MDLWVSEEQDLNCLLLARLATSVALVTGMAVVLPGGVLAAQNLPRSAG